MNDDRTPEKRRPVDMKGIAEAAADANLPPPPDEEAVALKMQGAQVVLEPDSAARAGAMGVYPTIEENRVLRDAGYLQMGLNPRDPSNELTDPPVLPEGVEPPTEPPPEGGNGGEGEGEATEAPVVVDTPYASQEGEVLAVTMGNWENEPTEYHYQWSIDAMLVGDDANTYPINEADKGHSATCVVTAVNAAGSTDAPPSNAVFVA